MHEPESFRTADTGTRADNCLIVHVADPGSFAQGHLPGARLVTPRELVAGTPPAAGRLPPQPRIEAMLSRIGYRPDQHVIVCDDEGGGWAGRFAWTLDIAGHHNWGYIDGGVHALYASGVRLVSGAPEPVEPTPVNIRINQDPIAEISDILPIIGSAGHVVLDVRSREEYLGQRIAAARAGHIPGAVNIDWQHFQDRDRHTRLVRNLLELLADSGITPDKQVITHCQSHHRSGLSYMALRLLGYHNVKAYHGSWSEWGNHPDTPIER